MRNQSKKNLAELKIDDDVYGISAEKLFSLSNKDVHRIFLHAPVSKAIDKEFNEYLEATDGHAKKFNMEG